MRLPEYHRAIVRGWMLAGYRLIAHSLSLFSSSTSVPPVLILLKSVVGPYFSDISKEY
jgi:hypothetical protein